MAALHLSSAVNSQPRASLLPERPHAARCRRRAAREEPLVGQKVIVGEDSTQGTSDLKLANVRIPGNIFAELTDDQLQEMLRG